MLGSLKGTGQCCLVESRDAVGQLWKSVVGAWSSLCALLLLLHAEEGRSASSSVRSSLWVGRLSGFRSSGGLTQRPGRRGRRMDSRDVRAPVSRRGYAVEFPTKCRSISNRGEGVGAKNRTPDPSPELTLMDSGDVRAPVSGRGSTVEFPTKCRSSRDRGVGVDGVGERLIAWRNEGEGERIGRAARTLAGARMAWPRGRESTNLKKRLSRSAAPQEYSLIRALWERRDGEMGRRTQPQRGGELKGKCRAAGLRNVAERNSLSRDFTIRAKGGLTPTSSR